MDMEASIETIKGIGPKTAESLRRAGFSTVGDLLYFLPRMYENYQTAVNIADLQPGKVIVRGKISKITSRRGRRRNFTITEATISDQSGTIRTVWFNQPYRAKQFDEKREYFFTGNFEFKNGRYQLTSPSAVLAEDIATDSAEHTPLYSSRLAIKPQQFAKFIQNLQPGFAKIPDLLPETQNLPDFAKKGARAEALYDVHFPESDKQTERGRRYLAYEELFELILASKLNSVENSKLKSIELPFVAEQTGKIVNNLPFPLTNAQRRATWEILQDLGKSRPMNRLLQGDVGAGKTVVAAIAAAQAIASGHQVAILAPTAILASQHYESFVKTFANFGSKSPQIALLTGATKKKKQLKEQIKNGEVNLVIGTHALLTDDTEFNSLAFCVIDEQHRFGVNQRQKLLLKSPVGKAPHLLAMTATPIPRSLQLTVFGDLDCSILNELPKGRQSIETKILPELHQKDDLYPRMHELLAKGQQIYWICKLVEDGAVSELTSVKKQVTKLEKLFPNYSVKMLHGKMKPDEKDQIMAEFAANKIQILVSTTVVEVGVNVPNANMIIIQDSESYGLAQLHQLRGRVGRGDQPASCYLLTTSEGRPSRRLREMEKSTDGFYLAEVDLKLRGPGEIYGSMQHGELNLRIANLSDSRLVALASRHAADVAKTPEILSSYPELQHKIQHYQQITTLN